MLFKHAHPASMILMRCLSRLLDLASPCAVGDGSVHPLAAQTIAFLKRLLSFRTAAAVIFDKAASPTAEIFQPGIQSPAQVNLAYASYQYYE